MKDYVIHKTEVPGFGKGKIKISFSSLSDHERNEIFDKMEVLGIVSS
jgi:hypothetical protein